MSIEIKLAGRAAPVPRLPPLLQGAARSAEQGRDRFLPEGYLEPTGTFDVSGAARSGDEAAVQQQLSAQPDEVVVLELADGSMPGHQRRAAARRRSKRAQPELLGPDGEVLLEKLRADGAAPRARARRGGRRADRQGLHLRGRQHQRCHRRRGPVPC